jgi:hypothetical protein
VVRTDNLAYLNNRLNAARRPLVDQWGKVVGYLQPRFFCPPDAGVANLSDEPSKSFAVRVVASYAAVTSPETAFVAALSGKTVAARATSGTRR